MKISLVIFAALLLLGCKPFVSTEDFASSLNMDSVIVSSAPPSSAAQIAVDIPQGQLVIEAPSLSRVSTLRGIDIDEPLHAVRVVEVVTNQSNDLWFMDRDEQQVDFSTKERSVVLPIRPAEVPPASIVEIEPHTKAWITLYFDVSPVVRGVDAAAFQVVWVVHTGGRRVEGRAVFKQAEQVE